MHANSRPITSNQTGIHQKLAITVERHLKSRFRQPLQDHTRVAFAEAADFVARCARPLVLDAGCGNGHSSYRLARRHPDCCVIGIDKSAQRLHRGHQTRAELIDADKQNVLLLRADISDFWRLAEQAGWRLAHHYLLYPNPWPKAAHLQRRWHGSALFPTILALGGHLQLRTNWSIYAQEFAHSLQIAGLKPRLQPLQWQGDSEASISPFEEKYRRSGHILWRCDTELGELSGNDGLDVMSNGL